MKKIRILINGANGRMGQASVKAISGDNDFELVATTNREDNLAEQIKKTQAQVVLDFTTAGSVAECTKIIIDSGAHPVIGTTGLTQQEIQSFQKQCATKKLGGIIAPNFSLGAVLMMKYSHEIAKYFSDVEIIEMHHDGKLDSPSGTAIRTAELISKGRTGKQDLKSSRETVKGTRGGRHEDVSIHAIRLPGLVAHQQVIFGGVGETLTIRHDSIDRIAFMPGVVLACKKVTALNELIYGLENIL